MDHGLPGGPVAKTPCSQCRRLGVQSLVSSVQFRHSVVSSSVTAWTAARQASLSFTISQRLLKRMSIESMMPSNRLTLGHPLLILPSIFPSVKVFSNELALSTGGEWIHIYVWLSPLLSTCNYHNTVNQLYSNIK